MNDNPLYSLDAYVYVDIETIPSQSPDVLEDFKRTVKAPATYKKPESIEKWLDENREAAAKDAMAKTSFDGGSGHICTIAWAKNDGPIKSAHAKTIEQEADVLRAFFDDLDDYHSETIVGHHVAGFDLPFMRKRAIVLGVKMPPATLFPRDPKPWDKGIHDTMIMWAGAKDRIGMDKLCEILGITGKGNFDGSMVADAWANGDHDVIEDYCRDDVWRTREVHKRFLMAGW